MTSLDGKILKRLKDEEPRDAEWLTEKVNIHIPNDDHEHDVGEIREHCGKLQEKGFISLNSGKFCLTETGERYLEGNIDEYELYSSSVPIHIHFSRKIGGWTLTLLDVIESNQYSTIKDIDKARDQVEYHFLDVFSQRFYQYTLFLAIIVGFWFSDGLIDGFKLCIPLYEILTLLGTLLLARSIVRGRYGIAVETEESAGRTAGMNSPALMPSAVRATVYDTVDGLWGAILIVIGFSFQVM
ncbi:hypothetical protein ACFR99_05970 [Haloarchaeobius amylolyticus]|uniref:Uncharacterized protein n=1 Tax=Haloarchaeobius amylolyticus TaxID=1198296 RepID=A0ABD6BEC7_9EURY